MPLRILAIVEHNRGELGSAALPLVSTATRLAAKAGGELAVLVLGSKLEKVVDGLKNSGTDSIYAVDDSKLEPYHPLNYVSTSTRAVQKLAPGIVLMAQSYFSSELGPALGVALDIPVFSNCLGIDFRGEKWILTRPMFGGEFHARMEVNSSPAVIVSLQAMALAQGTITRKIPSIVSLDCSNESWEDILQVIEQSESIIGEDHISKADIIIALGRGIGEQKNIEVFRKLAGLLSAELACSRPLVDMQWFPADRQVGMSGRTVEPRVYLACGISGAAQHIAGMHRSRLVIAINKDPSAPIFQVAHYGVVADLFELLPEMIRVATMG